MSFALFSQKSKEKKADKHMLDWRYEIEASEQQAPQGMELVKVWVYSKDPVVAAEQTKKNAIHGIIFKGVSPKGGRTGKAPLYSDTYDSKKEFFDGFFQDGGDYQRYVQLTNNGSILPGDILKVDKKEYKIGLNILVNFIELKRFLEKKEIIRGLSTGF